MNLKDQNVLFFTRTMKLGGTENVILQLCEILKPLVNKIIVCSSGGINEEKLECLGIKHYKIPDIEQKKPQNFLLISRRLMKVVNDEKITIIHTHHRMAAFYVTALGLYKKCAFLNTSHNTFNDKKMLTRFSYKNAKLIACGNKVKNNLEEVFGLSDITVVRNSVPNFEQEILIDELIKNIHDEDNFIVANIGRLSKQKGMEYYIEAIPRVLKYYPNVRFLVVGVGEDEKKLKLLAEQLRIEKVVYFLGYRSDIQNIISQVDLVVLSSLWEGFPLTPIEVFSVGKTIIATAVDGTVEIVENGVNGILINPKSESDIAEKIVYMIDNPDVKKRMEINALKTYKEKLSIKQFAEQYIDCYEGCE